MENEIAMILQISALIIAIAILALVGFAIPTIIQLRKSVKKIEDIGENLDKQLPDILQNVQQITSNLSGIMDTGRRQVETVGGTIDDLKTVVDDIVGVEKKIKYSVDTRLIRSLATITAGVKAAKAFKDVMNNGRPPKNKKKRRFFSKK